jgi:hypothetical protein
MNNELLLSYQRKLIYACLEEFSGIGAMGDYAGGQYGLTPRVWWQESVDFLYRNLVCGLIEPNPIHTDLPIGNPVALCQLFAANNPNDASFWFYVQFNGTTLLVDTVKKHGLLDWACFQEPLRVDFMREIAHIYASMGVSFSEEVLLPIHP